METLMSAAAAGATSNQLTRPSAEFEETEDLGVRHPRNDVDRCRTGSESRSERGDQEKHAPS